LDILQQNLQNQKILIGCSFAPKKFSKDPKVGLDALQILIKTLHIKHIRFPLDWNRIETQKGTLTLDFFRPYIDILIENNIKICLNVGPIKTFRWPEAKIPKFIDKPQTLTRKHQVITVQSDLSRRSIEYLNKLLELLKKTYGKSLNPDTIQPENEAFFNFGHLQLTMDYGHMTKVVNTIHHHYPNKRILLNSAGRRNLSQIINFMKKYRQFPSTESARFRVGYDYYHRVKGMPVIYEYIDHLTLDWPWNMSIKTLKKKALQENFEIEVTEAQFRPWGKYKKPGDSFEDLLYVLTRCSTILPKQQSEKIIRLWGIEAFAKKILGNNLTSEHHKMIKLITSF